MLGGATEDGPVIRPVDSVSTATVAALCIGGAFLVCAAAMTWWLCRRRREHTKLNSEKSLAFRPPHRKPTAVKSPGSTGHYLKKSPSPTGPAKSPPGSAGQTPSPTGSHSSNSVSQPRTPQGAGTPVQTPTGEINITIENERDKAEIENTEKVEREKSNGSESKENKDNLGHLVFKLRYVREKHALEVTVVKCEGLPAKGQQNPYVKLQLLPDRQDRVKTRFVRNTTDPVYDEEFTFFGISRSHLQNITLHFIVMSFDKYSRDSIIGELTCALATVPGLEDADNYDMSLRRKICPRGLKIQSQGRGELLVAFFWNPANSRLTVVVLKARDLPKMDVSGTADPYVKIYLLQNQQRIAKKKTHVKKDTLDPVFNESFDFDIPRGANSLSDISLEFMLLDWDRVTKNEVIGRLEFGGAKCEGSALKHWQEVCNTPRRQIALWHKLRE